MRLHKNIVELQKARIEFRFSFKHIKGCRTKPLAFQGIHKCAFINIGSAGNVDDHAFGPYSFNHLDD